MQTCANTFGTQSAPHYGVRKLQHDGRNPPRPFRGNHRQRWGMDYIKVPDLPWWLTREDYTRPASNGGGARPTASGSDIESVPGPNTCVSNPPPAPVYAVTPAVAPAVGPAGRRTGTASAAVRGPLSGPSCHQCKRRRMDPKMTCAGKKVVRGKPCGLVYCKPCIEKQ